MFHFLQQISYKDAGINRGLTIFVCDVVAII